MDGISVLREAISTIPVPSAPPRLSRDGAAVGLGLLDAALRLNHVRRLTERLTVTQHRIAQRTTEVDISINMLTDTQLEAARRFQALAGHSTDSPGSGQDAEGTVWVPVARLSRTNVGPIEVHDARGQRLPRLTQYETSRLIASGLYRLLRGILVSHPDARSPNKELGKLLYRVHEPRWLIQSAILTVLTEGSKPQARVDPAGLPSHVRLADLEQHRKMALNVFDACQSLLADYFQLFDIAVNDHIVVVALDSRIDEHLLTYESPLYVNERDRWSARVWRLIRASRRGYYVSYWTDIPTTLRSYHLVAEAAPGVDVTRIFLTTNAHENEVDALSEDLRIVADRLDKRPNGSAADGTERVIELKLETLLRQLSELMRRRSWEASTAGVSPPLNCVTACSRLVEAATEAEAQSQRNGHSKEPVLVNPLVSPQNLRNAALEIDRSELRYDIAVELQPTTNRAHVYWRRPPLGPASSGQTHIRSGMLLRNTAESSTRMVVVYALVVAFIAYVVALFLTRTPWPYGPSEDGVYSALPNREAIIAILLLVPGFLYTRLSLPERHSIAGHLRAVPRLVAYICISSMVILAADVAVDSIGSLTRVVFLIGSTIPVASTLLLVLLGSRQSGTAQILARLDAPGWVTDEDAQNVKRLIPDAMFSSARRAR